MMPTQGYATMSAKPPCNPSHMSNVSWEFMTCSSLSPIAGSVIQTFIKPVTNGVGSISHR